MWIVGVIWLVRAEVYNLESFWVVCTGFVYFIRVIRLLLRFAAAYDTPLTSDPPLITLITLSCLGGAGGVPSLTPFEPLSLVARPRSISKSFKWPCFSSSATSSRRAWHSSVRWPWSLWNSHHFLVFLVPAVDFIFCGHFTASPFLSGLLRVQLARCSDYIRVVWVFLPLNVSFRMASLVLVCLSYFLYDDLRRIRSFVLTLFFPWSSYCRFCSKNLAALDRFWLAS